MRVLLFGATGMVGQGVLRECLAATDVSEIVTIGRTASGQSHAKLKELVHADLSNVDGLAPQLGGFDACFYCLGVSSAGMSEKDYTRVTYDYAMGPARLLARVSPGLTFVFVSGEGTDSSEKGGSMWARVKGRTENAVLALPFKGAYMFRPGIIQPLHGIVSKTKSYRILYAVLGPVLPALGALFPGMVTSTERVGRAMLAVARHGSDKKILNNRDINALGSV